MNVSVVTIVVDHRGIAGVYCDDSNVRVVVARPGREDAWQEPVYQNQYIPAAATKVLVDMQK